MDHENQTYREQTGYITADKRGQVIPRAGLRRLVLALDAATVEKQFILRGDYLYVDSLSTGLITAKLNSTAEDPIPLTSQASVEGFPMKEVFLSWAAQPGLIVNLWYGYQGRLRPPQTVVQLAGGVSLLQTVSGVPQGADQATSNGRAYGFAHAAGAVAANNSACMIKNPVGSGKRIYIDRIRVGSFSGAAQGEFDVFVGSTADGAAHDGVFGANKKTGLRDGVADFFRDFANTVLGGFVIERIIPNSVSGDGEARFASPIILDPGQRAHVINNVQQQQCNASWEFREY